MHTISQEAYRFLTDAFEDAVETFFDALTEYADGDPLKKVFEDLKKIGEELEIDILSLAVEDDLERLESAIKKEEGDEFEDESLTTTPDNAPEWPTRYGHMDNGGYIPQSSTLYNPSPYNSSPYNINKEENRSVEEKLKELSKERCSNEMIGEWTTYEIEED